MNLTPDETRKVLDDLFASTMYPEKAADEYTINELMEMYGLSKWLADKRVRRLVDSGKLTRREAICNGHKCLVYKVAG